MTDPDKSEKLEKSEKKLTKKQRQLEAARVLHAEWVEDNGHGGDIISDMSYRAHACRVLVTLGLQEGWVIELTQKRVQAGLKAIDVIKIALEGNDLRALVEKSQEEIAEATIRNKEQAEKEALRKKQRNAFS